MATRYLGKKEVIAVPMTRLQYNQYRQWDLPADEDGSDEGYLVEYVDGGKSNHPNHTGYISWSPKDVFERAYIDITTHTDRLQLEHDELKEKVVKLTEFIEVNNTTYTALPMLERKTLRMQLMAMRNYLEILKIRLNS